MRRFQIHVRCILYVDMDTQIRIIFAFQVSVDNFRQTKHCRLLKQRIFGKLNSVWFKFLIELK